MANQKQELTFGKVKKGDFVECGIFAKVWRIEELEWWEDGKLRHLRMVDENGEGKTFSHLSKQTRFQNGRIVEGFKNDSPLSQAKAEIEKLRRALEGMGKAVEFYSGMKLDDALENAIKLVRDGEKLDGQNK